jgi:hypothetical protein
MRPKRKQTTAERRIMGFVKVGKVSVSDADRAIGASHTTRQPTIQGARH